MVCRLSLHYCHNYDLLCSYVSRTIRNFTVDYNVFEYTVQLMILLNSTLLSKRHCCDRELVEQLERSWCKADRLLFVYYFYVCSLGYLLIRFFFAGLNAELLKLLLLPVNINSIMTTQTIVLGSVGLVAATPAAVAIRSLVLPIILAITITSFIALVIPVSIIPSVPASIISLEAIVAIS